MPGVLIVKLDLLHDGNVVPLCDDDQRQALVDVALQLDDLLGKELFLRIDDDERACQHKLFVESRATTEHAQVQTHCILWRRNR